MKILPPLVASFPCLCLVTLALSAQAAVLSFDGGILNGTTAIPENTSAIGLNTSSYYREDGMEVTFSGVNVSPYIGDYYGRNNNVAHWHSTGTTINLQLVDGGNFDLNSLVLTSNTINGGGSANGTEVAYITASNGQTFLLPSNGWGDSQADATLTFDSTIFKNVEWIKIGATANVYCMGVDAVSFNVVPEISSSALVVMGMAGAMLGRRRR